MKFYYCDFCCFKILSVCDESRILRIFRVILHLHLNLGFFGPEIEFKLGFRDRRLVGSDRDGVLCNNPNFHCYWNHRIFLCQNLLQQRAFCKFIAPNIGYYSDCLLLDDVGNRLSCADESTHSPNS